MKANLVRLLCTITLTGAAACSSATDVTKPPAPEVPKFTCLDRSATMPLPADLRATLPTFGVRTPDDAYAAISQSVPGGFAGVFYEESHLVLTFTDPAKADAARAQISQAFVDHGFTGLDVGKAEFRSARWTFAELDEWYRYITPKIGGTGSGVSFTDIDEKANTISIGVIDEASRTALESRLASLNVSCNLVTTVIRPYAQLV